MPARSPTYVSKAQDSSIAGFLLDIIPTTLVSALTEGSILQTLFVAILFGIALSLVGDAGAAGARHAASGSGWWCSAWSAILMRAAPIGAFGAIAFTIGKYGLGALVSLGALIATFYLTSLVFVLVVLGLIARIHGFSIIRLIVYLQAPNCCWCSAPRRPKPRCRA